MDEERINHVLNIDIPNWQRDWDNNFTNILISLIAKADPVNRAKLESVFPEEVEAFRRFQNQ